MARNIIAGAFLGLGLLAVAGAQAATSTLLPNYSGSGSIPSTSLTVGNWTVTFNPSSLANACAYLPASGGTSSGNCSPVTATGTVDSKGNLSVTFSAASNVLAVNNAVTGNTPDITIFETVTNNVGAKIWSTTLTDTGTSPGNVNFGGSETISLNSGGLPGPGIGSILLATASGGSTTTSGTSGFTPQSSVFITKDIRAGFTGGTSATVSGGVTTFTQVFNVPEPATMSVLAVGFAGIAALRRRRRARA